MTSNSSSSPLPERTGINRRSCRQGFTLLELLLVLSILVAVAALTAPAMRGPLESYRLRRSADLVRAAWTQARNAAMRTGSIQVFQYEIGGNQYQYHPWSTGADELESTVANPTQAGGGSVAMPGGATSLSIRILPENVVFVSGETVADTRTAALGDNAALGANVGGSGQAATGSWGTPVVFYPDGATSTAELILANTREQHIRLELRGLTGIAKVSDILSVEELLQ